MIDEIYSRKNIICNVTGNKKYVLGTKTGEVSGTLKKV